MNCDAVSGIAEIVGAIDDAHINALIRRSSGDGSGTAAKPTYNGRLTSSCLSAALKPGPRPVTSKPRLSKPDRRPR